MRAIALIAGSLAILVAVPGAHAKGGPVGAAEVCTPGGCRPVETTAAMDGLMPEVWSVAGEGSRHVDAVRDTPSFRIRLTLENPHSNRFLDPGAKALPPVALDYAPSIDAVRVVDPRSKAHWARIDGAALATLERMTTGLSPAEGKPDDGAAQAAGASSADGPDGSLVAAVALAFLGLLAAAAIVLPSGWRHTIKEPE